MAVEGKTPGGSSPEGQRDGQRDSQNPTGAGAADGRPSFRVVDRRSFSDSADSGAEPASGPASGGAGGGATGNAGGAPPESGAPARTAASPAEGSESLPAVDFHTFVLSLGSSVLLHLGELDHPDGGEPREDLALAKHTIDIIGMLQEKTKGNLTPAEEKLIESLLFDLRLRYVEKTKAAPGR